MKFPWKKENPEQSEDGDPPARDYFDGPLPWVFKIFLALVVLRLLRPLLPRFLSWLWH